MFHTSKAGRSVPSRKQRSRRRASTRSSQLLFFCHVQRSGRQHLAVPGDHNPVAGTWTQQSGRRNADGAFARGRAASWRVRTDRSEAPLVGLVRGLHRCAPRRQDSRRGRQRGQAPHRRGPLTAMKQFDAIIIGTGQAGPSLAARFSTAGKTVAIIERHKFGGTCVNTGCIPTKTMVASAYAAHIARRGANMVLPSTVMCALI